MGLDLHYAAKGVSDDPRKKYQREWLRRKKARIREEARRAKNDAAQAE